MTRTQQVLIWIGLWGFWVFVSRHNHPTLLLDCLATALLVAAFAAAVYFNWRILVPRFLRTRRLFAYWASLLAVVSALSAADALVISKVYDFVWGPDPRRFGFWVNFGLEFALICIYLLAAACVAWLVRRRRHSQPI